MKTKLEIISETDLEQKEACMKEMGEEEELDESWQDME